MILAGDIGGTKCTLTLFDSDGSQLKPLYRITMPTRDFRGFESVLEHFQAQAMQNGARLENL
ncbi:MAG TPA: glucokinase, partial [Terriglobales bacterium]|nr:glucokinase [Terriglobales bacterium]